MNTQNNLVDLLFREICTLRSLLVKEQKSLRCSSIEEIDKAAINEKCGEIKRQIRRLVQRKYKIERSIDIKIMRDSK